MPRDARQRDLSRDPVLVDALRPIPGREDVAAARMIPPHRGERERAVDPAPLRPRLTSSEDSANPLGLLKPFDDATYAGRSALVHVDGVSSDNDVGGAR